MIKMVQGSSLGLECIKTENKEGNEEIKTLHYKINDILYKHNKQYISDVTARRISKELTQLGVELKNCTVKGKEELKQKEILQALRTIVKNLNGYADDFSWDDVDLAPIQSTVNYCVAQYVKMKKESELGEVQILRLLNRQKEVIEDFLKPSDEVLKDLNIIQFKKMNEELLKMLADRYSYLSLIE